MASRAKATAKPSAGRCKSMPELRLQPFETLSPGWSGRWQPKVNAALNGSPVRWQRSGRFMRPCWPGWKQSYPIWNSSRWTRPLTDRALILSDLVLSRGCSSSRVIRSTLCGGWVRYLPVYAGQRVNAAVSFSLRQDKTPDTIPTLHYPACRRISSA